MWLLVTKRVPTVALVFVFIASFPSMACTGGSRLKLEGTKLGRDTEGTGNRYIHSNMATRSLGILGRGHGPWAP